MKPAKVTISYLVYPPDYDPFVNKYYKIDTLKKAKRKAISLGFGSEVVRNVHKMNRKGRGGWWNDGFILIYEEGRK